MCLTLNHAAAASLVSASLALTLLAGCGRPSETPTAPVAAATSSPAPATTPPGAATFKVVDGYKVDPVTLTGFRTWRAAACDRCHGANQEGMVGPSLINSLKTLTKDEFVATVTKGRLEKGMPSFSTSADVTEHIDALYQYLKGRSDGAITRAKVEPMS